VDLHSLALTPPLSSDSRSTGRLPTVAPKPVGPPAPTGGIVINTAPPSGPGKTVAADSRRAVVPTPGATSKPVVSRSAWYARRYAGLPLLVWLASVLLLILPLLVGGWLWLGHSGDHVDTDEATDATELPADADGSAIAEPPRETKPATPSKNKPAPKPDRRPPPRKKQAKPSEESSGPSPLDNLESLAPEGSAAKPGSDGK
jgi:hypothetical protein